MQRSVEVHVTFLKIGEIDTTKEVFNADVVVTSSWREPLFETNANNQNVSVLYLYPCQFTLLLNCLCSERSNLRLIYTASAII